MSVKFQRVSMRNFLGFGNIEEEVDLSFEGTTLILGENLDKGGANGVGKTSVINAISYALYNKPISSISKEKLINSTNNSKNTDMVVTLEFEANDHHYLIRRARGANSDTKLYIDEEDKTPDSVANTDKAIQDIVGISYELFKRTVVFNGHDQAFFEMSAAQQRELIEELLGITTLSEKAESLKKLNSLLDKEIEVQAVLVLAQEKALGVHSKHISDAEARVVKWESDREQSLIRLQAKLEQATLIDFEAEAELLAELEILFNEIKTYNPILSGAARDVKSISTDISKDEADLRHLRDAKCPYCLQKFEDSQAKIEEIEIRLEENKIKLIATTKLNDETKVKVDDLNQQLIDVKNVCHFASMAALNIEKANASSYEVQIVNHQHSTNPHVESYEKLLTEESVEVDYTKLDELKSEFEHQKMLLKLLTNKDSFIRKKLITKSLPFLNTQIHEHSKDLGLTHIVTFNPDMSCTITEFGRELDYGNLSGGERNRLNFALSFAFRDMRQHLHSEVNILFADEVDAGAMDVPGVEAIIKTIKKKAASENGLGIWIISHRPECGGRFDREMTIKFENGFSAIGDTVNT